MSACDPLRQPVFTGGNDVSHAHNVFFWPSASLVPAPSRDFNRLWRPQNGSLPRGPDTLKTFSRDASLSRNQSRLRQSTGLPFRRRECSHWRPLAYEGLSRCLPSVDPDTALKELVATANHYGMRSTRKLPFVVEAIDVADLVYRESLPDDKLPSGRRSEDWRRSNLQTCSNTQQAGVEWLRQGRTCLLFVPSAVVDGGLYCLIDSRHSDFGLIQISGSLPPSPLKAPSRSRSKTSDDQVHDVFLCHANEDKKAVVEPLVARMKAVGISYWYDREKIRWGDSLTEHINDALAPSRFVIVILSLNFLRKQWAKRELHSALAREVSLGRTFVLPLIIGNDSARLEIIGATVLQNHKMYLTWDGDPEPIVGYLLEIISQFQ
jgi:hypothetical protein